MTSYFYVPNDTNFVVRSELANKTPEIPDLPTFTEFSVNACGDIEVLVIPPLETKLTQLRLNACVIKAKKLTEDEAEAKVVSVTQEGKKVTLDVPTQKVIRIPTTEEVFSLFKLFICFVLSVVLVFVCVLLGVPPTAQAIIIVFIVGMLLWATILGLTVKKPIC